MKIIQNTEQNFEAAFEYCLISLRLEKVQNQNWLLIPEGKGTPETQFLNALQEMHRRFVYEINILKKKLEDY